MSIAIETPVSEKQFLSTGDVASLTGFTIQKVRALCELGRLPAVNTSTTDRPRWTIRRVDLEAFLTPAAVTKAESAKKTATRRRRLDEGVERVYG
jgi:hypothetical protein